MRNLSISEVAAVKKSSDSLINIAKNLGRRHTDSGNPRKRTAFILLYALQSFGKKQLDFFEKGFHQKQAATPTDGFLLEAFGGANVEYPPRYPFHEINHQITSDIEIITRAINNRESTAPILLEADPKALNPIELTDRLAYLAIEPTIQLLIIKPSTILTYLQKLPSARVIPYAPVAIVGIPLRAVENDFDLLATPHEIGHYVYRRIFCELTQNGSRVQNFRDPILANLESPADEQATLDIKVTECARNWFEEIFADVYGCLIAGPMSAIQMQEILSGLPTSKLIEDDADHPLPALRPFIYTETLKQMAQVASSDTKFRLIQAAEELERKWNEQLLSLHTETFTLLSKNAITQENELIVLKRADMQNVLRQIVEELCKGTIKSLAEAQSQSLEKLWYRGSTAGNGADLEMWRIGFTKFVKEARLDQSIGGNYQELDLIFVEGKEYLGLTQPHNQDDPNRCLVGSTGLPFDHIREEVLKTGEPWDTNRIDYQNSKKTQWWLYILDANGWTSQGPGPGNVAKD